MVRTWLTEWSWLALCAIAAGTSAVGCGSSETEVINHPNGTGGTGGTGGSDGGAGTGGSGGTDGGYVDPDAYPNDDSGFDPDAACAWSTTTPERAGVDIIFIIDNSHSMGDEIVKTMANINTFSNVIAASGLDYQVIMLTAKGTNLTDMTEDVPNLKGSSITGDMPLEVCVPPPLGMGPNGADPCGDNPPRFHHLDHWPVGIASHNGMWLGASMYQTGYTWVDDAGPDGGGWAKWARFNATKYFVMITDDDAYYPDPTFGDPSIVGNATEPYDIVDRLLLHDTRFGPPGMFGDEQKRKYVYNAICGWVFPGGFAMDPDDGGGCRTDYNDPEYNFAMSPGEQHQKLAQLTGGIVDSICRSDWSSVLDNLADEVISTLGCEYAFPESDGGVINPNMVLVQHTPQGGSPEALTRVTDLSKCSQFTDGWYYDDNDAPTKVILCPDACATIGSADTGQVDLLLGCNAPPPK
jgi:hypothetical protein